ncbi:hypothetical protein MHM88_14635 [Epibacterium sp. MM17-32]|uniref:hypothetical protein n=1 Tax=Epibacterium sp. MM17-32 TaxID=2917734 RepID=UPI001EF5B50E|nr:hypothetical protein [Epibacterium sp. MM17-32]MCG7629045.1 hypothetical protein [Epibacterium sp. MM17-32]
MNIFEKASRQKLRFPSVRGELTAEQLWDLPLTSAANNKADLDTIARNVNGELKSLSEDSFVQTKPDPRKPTLELQLDILKHIIASKLKDAEEAKTAAQKVAKRRKILEALADREEQELAGKSKEELLAELEALG